MFKALKNRKGFSLVELIVVIVIMGILVAVAVPSLIGYITKANVASDVSAASGLSNAAIAYVIQNQVETGILPGAFKTALEGDGSYTDANWPTAKATTGVAATKNQMTVEYDYTNGRIIIVRGPDGAIILPTAMANPPYGTVPKSGS